MKKFHLLGWTLALVLCVNAGYAQFITNNGITITNGAMLVTNGDWTNASGTNIVNNGIIRTSQPFINNGTLDASSTGGFALHYTTDMNFQPGGSSMGFLSKSGAGNLLAANTLSIRDSLMLRGGLVRLLNTTDTVSLRSGALVLASATSYVEGMVARAGTGNLLFPLGKDGNYLPLTMNKVSAKKLTASVEATPGSHTAGPGVDALIAFPYAWKVSEQLNADTAAYVEVNYPNTLPVVANPIVVRQVPGQQFASMGARIITNTGGRVTVRSYSRGTKGLFTIARGFPSDFKTDSLALVALYNATGGNGWVNKNLWLQKPVDEWAGITVTGQSITAINLANNGLTGAVPDHVVDILSLQTVNLSGNAITSIPVFTENPQITSLNVTNNKLTFASLEPNAGVLGLNYTTQAVFGSPRNESVAVGTAVTFEANAGGSGSVYQWKRNGVVVPGANAPVYNVPSIGKSTMGEYIVEVTNPSLPQLVLRSAPQVSLAHADIAGKLYIAQQQPATKGEMVLYRVNTSKFDIVKTAQLQNDGSYSFEDIVLDDYQVKGFADTLVHARALPTYYESTIFWEEADTLFLENNVTALDIYSVIEPGPPSGRGVIDGTFEEDVPEGSGGRTMLPQPVKRAGVSARRVQSTGRGKEEILVLVAYVFTDDQGRFSLPNLPNGTYRLNFQYPGYPMDESTDVTIVINDGLQSQATVDAKVEGGKITVRKRVITGLFDSEKVHVRLFPNPAVDYINLYFETEEKGRTIDVSSMNGRKLVNTLAEGKEAQVNMQHVERGIYILRIMQEGVSVKTLKVLIE